MDLSSTSRHKWQLCTSTADLQPVWTVLVPWFMLGHTVLVWCRGELNRRGSAHYSKSEIIKVISNFGNMTFMTKKLILQVSMSAVRTMYISFILKSTLPSTVSPNSPCYPWVNWRGHPCLGTTQRSTQRGALVQIIPCGSG